MLPYLAMHVLGVPATLVQEIKMVLVLSLKVKIGWFGVNFITTYLFNPCPPKGGYCNPLRFFLKQRFLPD